MAKPTEVAELCVIEFNDEGKVHAVYAPLGVTGDRPTAVNKLCELVAEHAGADDEIEEDEIGALQDGVIDRFATPDGWAWEIKEVRDY